MQAQLAASGDLSLPLQIVTGSNDTPVEPGNEVASGAASAIPLLIGTSRDEVPAWLGQDSKMLQAINWDIVEKLYGMAGVAAPFAYGYAKRKAADEKPWQILSEMATNATFRKSVIAIADGPASHGGEAYVYRFDWRPSPDEQFGACHSIKVRVLAIVFKPERLAYDHRLLRRIDASGEISCFRKLPAGCGRHIATGH